MPMTADNKEAPFATDAAFYIIKVHIAAPATCSSRAQFVKVKVSSATNIYYYKG